MTEHDAQKVNELFKQIDELKDKYQSSLESVQALSRKLVEYADALAEDHKCNKKK